LSYIQFSEQPLSSTSNHSDYKTQPQRGDFENYKTHSPSLQYHTPQVKTPSDFAGLHTHLQVYESTITRIMKGIENT